MKLEPIKYAMKMFDVHYCECGICGKLTTYGRKYKTGHNSKGKTKETCESIKKQSEKLKGIVAWNKGKTGVQIYSEERNRKIAIARRGRLLSKETRIKMSKSHKGKKLSEINKQRIGESSKGRVHSEESKCKIKKARLKQHTPFKDTKIERLIQDELSYRGYAYYCHYPILGQPDIAFPDQKIAIFADGCYWHGCPVCAVDKKYRERNEIKDKRVTKYLQERGWLVLRYWEHEINTNVEAVVDEIEDCLFGGDAKCSVQAIVWKR